jgi:hypothetical protein
MTNYQIGKVYRWQRHYYIVYSIEEDGSFMGVKWLTNYYEFGGNLTRVFANSLVYENSVPCY